MIGLQNLPKTTIRGKKRLGRGHGSGRGKTAGRGTKGQMARGKIPLTIAGSYLATVKRLPLLKGKYRNKPLKHKSLVVNVKYLNAFKANDIIDADNLVTCGIIKKDDADHYRIKILGNGELKLPLIVKLPCSKGARGKIIAAGGKVEDYTNNLTAEKSTGKKKVAKKEKKERPNQSKKEA